MNSKRLMSTDPPEVMELFASIASHSTEKLVASRAVVVRSVAIRYATKTDFSLLWRWSGKGWRDAGIEHASRQSTLRWISEPPSRKLIKALSRMASIVDDMAIRATAGARVRLEKVLDLTKPTTLKAIGFGKHDLVSENWKSLQESGEESWTQAIGRGAILAEFEALIAPSFSTVAKKGKNIVIFPDNLIATSHNRNPWRGSTSWLANAFRHAQMQVETLAVLASGG